MNDSKGNILLYQTEDGQTKIEVILSNDTVWLTADQMAELFQRNKSTISRHIKNMFESGELNPNRSLEKYAFFLSYFCYFYSKNQALNNITSYRNKHSLTIC